jgi:hypothetical protein
MLALYTAPAGLALAGCMASANTLAYLAVARLQRIKPHLIFLNPQQVIDAINHPAIFRSINHFNGLMYTP